MLHRATWVALPVIGAIVIGTGTGWWGYNQYRQKQGLAMQAENSYEVSFHGLVSDMNQLKQELGKAAITSDRPMFQDRVRSVWRLSYASQTEIGRLPLALMPMHQTQMYLADVSQTMKNWMDAGEGPTSSTVRGKLKTLYQSASQVTGMLNQLQAKVSTNQMGWLAANQALAKGATDNQIVDGFKQIDNASSAFTESARPSLAAKSLHADGQGPVGPMIDKNQAIVRFASFVRNVNPQSVRVTSLGKGAQIPAWQISASTAQGAVTGLVSKRGGDVLQLHIDTSSSSSGSAVSSSSKGLDFATAEEQARKWLMQRGFGQVESTDATEYDGTGYFVFSPVRHGAVVISQPITVRMALDTGNVSGFDATQVYEHPLRVLPKARFTPTALESRLNPDFQVRMYRKVILLNAQQQFVPAVAFYGTSQRETYAVYYDAVTGREIGMDVLTSHDLA